MKVLLLGLNIRHTQLAVMPCLSIYNLKLYALRDEELKKNTGIRLIEEVEDVDDDVIFKAITKYQPDVIGITCYLWSTKRLLSIVKTYLERGNEALVFLGGPDAANQAEKLLTRYEFVSGIAYGEGEETFRLLLRRLDGVDNEPWQKTPGLIIRTAKKYQTNPLPKPIDLDTVPVTLYDEEFLGKHGPWLYTETARGCVHRCAYCSYPVRGYKRRTRTIEKVMESIDHLIEIGGRNASLLDPGFNQNKDRSKNILRHLIDKGRNISLADLEINLEELDDEEIGLISKLTTGRMEIGLQTTNPIALKNICRAYNEKTFKKNLSKFSNAGKEYNVHLICGLPGDNYDTFKNSYNEVVDMGPHKISIFMLEVLPGTKFYDEADKHGLVFDTEPPYEVHYCNTFTIEDMLMATRLLHINTILSTFNNNNIPFQLLCRKADMRPSDLIEEFCKGWWRGGEEVTDNELLKWRDKENVESVINVTGDIFAYVQDSFIGKKLSPMFKDICELQYSLGRINANYVDETENQRVGGTSNNDLKVSLSKNARLVKLSSNVYETLRYRRIDDTYVPTQHYTMLLYRDRTSMRSFKTSDLIEKILRVSHDGLSLGEIADVFSGTNSREQIVSTISELAKTGALRIS